MTVRSTKLATATVPASTQATIYTVPTGYRVIVKSITWTDFSGTSDSVQLNITDQTNGTAVYLFDLATLPARRGDWTGWMVLHAPDIIQAAVGGQPVSFWVSGTMLQLTGTEAP